MDPLSVTATTIAIVQLTGVIIEYLNDVKGASTDLKQCAIEISNVSNLLVTLIHLLDEASSDEGWYTEVQALAAANGPIDQYRSVLEHLQLKLTSTASSGLKRIGGALTWTFSKEEVTNILTRIERLKSLIQIALEMDHLKLSQALKSHDSQQYRVIMDWLSSADFPAQQSDLISRRQEGTGLWFLLSPEFTNWLQGTKQNLFCPGIHGAGKTMIAAIAVDHIWKAFHSNNVGVAYVYCNFKRRETQTAADLLAAILKQLVQERPLYGEAVATLHKLHANQRTRPSLDEIWTALKSVLINYSKAYIIIDALDECTDSDGTRSELLTILRTLQAKTDISLMATSRFVPTIVQSFQGFPMLEIRASDADVTRFVAGHIHRLPEYVQRDPVLQAETQDRIVQAVDGMFLLARLHVDSLRGKTTKKKFRSTLENLPKGLTALTKAYDEAIERTEGSDSGIPAPATAMSRDSGYASMVSKQLLKRGCSDSDTKSIASLESHVTLVSSLNPADVGGAAEELAEILWDSEDIRRCVKLGFVAMDSDRFERNFLRLIKSYASELRAEADTIIQKRATRIVHNYGAYVTRIIRRRVVGDDSQAAAFHSIKDQTATKLTLERFLAQQQSIETPDQEDTRPEDEQESNGNSHSDDEEPYLPNLEKLTDFLISSTAFEKFRTQLEVFVKSNSRLQQTLEGSPFQSHIGKSDEYVPIEQPNSLSFLTRVKNFLRRSFRRPIPPGSQRVEWICECGDLLHMDFNSNSSGSFPTINALLCSRSATVQPSGSSHVPSQPRPGAISMPMPVRSTGTISQDFATHSGPAPRLHPSNTPRTLVGTDSTAGAALIGSNYIFFELCVNAGKLLKALGEIDVSSINTDGDFFHTVKAHYLRLRSFRARFWLLKPVNVSYVRFSVEDRCRVGILQKPVALPPKTEVDAKRYHYNPCPLENELPISSDLFLHYLFSCSSPSRNLIWLPRIPRKLDQSIFASPAPASFGWGVHIDEGPDYLKVFVLNLVILGVSGVAALLWESFKHDFQGAMGIAAWIVMLLNTLMAVFVAKWGQE